MSKFLLEHEIYFLQEIKKRDFTFDDGEIIRISMYQLLWNWYDRFSARDATFDARIKAGLRQEAQLRGTSCGETLQQVLEELVRRKFQRGKNPFETQEELTRRKLAMLDVRRARRTANTEAGESGI